MEVNGIRIASDEYVKQLNQMHSEPKKWGTTGGKKALYPAGLIKNHGFESMLDFGCGSGGLVAKVREMCPKKAVYGWDAARDFPWPDEPVDLLTSTDVMEHIEYEFLANVIKLQKSVAKKYMWHHIATGPAKKRLPDGRNAHLIQEDVQFWMDQYSDPDDDWYVYMFSQDDKSCAIHVVRPGVIKR